MSAASVSVIRRGPEKARTAPWRGDRATALLAPVPDACLLSVDFVRHCLDFLARQGFARVVTTALSPLEQAGFLAAGFAVEEDLRLLGMDITPAVAIPPGLPLRRVGRRRRAEVLEVDRAAFSEFWRFDDLALRDALRATPAVRFRAALSAGGHVDGYAISGRAGARGYVQRLAVRPETQGRGTGRRLLMDGLAWMARHGATRAYVNTQIDNHAALDLYRGVGFSDEPVGLAVLTAGLL